MDTRIPRCVAIGALVIAVLLTACTPTRRVTDIRDLAPVVGPVTTTRTVTTTTTVPDAPDIEWDAPDVACLDPEDEECEVLILEPDHQLHFMREPVRPPVLHHFRDPAPPVAETPHEISAD